MMSGKFFARSLAVAFALSLGACGGGGDGDGSSLGGPGSGSGGGTGGGSDQDVSVQVGSIQLRSSQPQVDTGGSTQATISAIVRSPDNVLMSGVEVTFSTDTGELLVSQPVTSESGIATASLSAGADARNRTISVQAIAGDVTSALQIPASGTSLSIAGPSSISLEDQATYTITLRNSADRGIEGEIISLVADGNPIQVTSHETDGSGVVSATVTANASGETTLRASAFEGEFRLNAEQKINISNDRFVFTAPVDGTEIKLGECQELALEWQTEGGPVDDEDVNLSTTRGALYSTDADCQADTTSFPTTTTVTVTDGTAKAYISSNASGFADITARTAATDVATSRSVEFVAINPATIRLTASRTQLSTGENADITAEIRDEFGNLVKGAAVTFDLVDVTGGRLSRGSDVTGTQGQARTTYIAGSSASEKDAIVVTARIMDSVTPVDPKSVSLTVGGQALTIVIGTGNEIQSASTTFYSQPWGILVTDVNGNARGNQEVELSVLPTKFMKGRYQNIASSDYEWVPTSVTECTPTNADKDSGSRWIANPASSPDRITTSADGSIEFDIRYSKSQCNWAEVRLTATARVDGEESQSSQTFILPCLADDLKKSSPPGGINSFYGVTSDCSVED